jgi:YHS domain-containing protein
MKTLLSRRIPLLALAGILTLTSVGLAQDKVEVPFYGNAMCPIMGKAVDRKWAVEHEGQKIYACCRKCWTKIKEDPAPALAKAYPKATVHKLEKCAFTGKDIPADAPTVTWQGHTIPFCCKNCVAKFKAEPNKHLTLILNKDIKAVGNLMCPLMEEEKIAPDHFFIYKKQLVNICCDSCVTDAMSDPEAAMKKLNPKK